MTKYNGWETWAHISTRVPEVPYVDPKEWQRQERIAVGRICRCGGCICCNEAKLTKEAKT